MSQAVQSYKEIQDNIAASFSVDEQTALFVDGQSLFSTSKNLGFNVDYKFMLQYFRKQTSLLRAYYYAALLDNDEFSPVKPLCDWMQYNDWKVVTKTAREFIDPVTNKRRIKGNVDVEIALDMHSLAMKDKIDRAILFSGDSDLSSLVEYVQREGVKVTVVSTIKTSPSMVSDELRRTADNFVDLAHIYKEFERKERPQNLERPSRYNIPDPVLADVLQMDED